MKLSKEEKAKYEVQKVISAAGVEEHTSEGWTILESFEVEDVVPCHEDIVPTFPVHVHVGKTDEYNGIGNKIAEDLGKQSVNQLRYEKVKCLAFLVGKTKESVLAEKKEEIDKLTEELHDGQEYAKELIQQRDQKDNDLKEEIGKRESECARAERNAKDRETFREAVRRLEGDIGKIRKAIGEHQMKDILGGGE